MSGQFLSDIMQETLDSCGLSSYTIGVPLPKTKKIVIPNKFITAVALNTAIQLPVISKIYPARYTPRNPKRIKFVIRSDSGNYIYNIYIILVY